MEITKYFFVALAMTLSVTIARGTHLLHPYDVLQCMLHQKSDARDSCLLGGKLTQCNKFKCFQTVGQPCTRDEHDAKYNGQECGADLTCSRCDKKCNGCMTVNGKKICHYSEPCMPMSPGKRNQMKLFPINSPEQSYDGNIEYPVDDFSLQE